MQTLAVGQTKAEKAIAVDERISALGFQGITMQPDLTNLFMLIAGRSGEGKSALIQSNPDIYDINVDCSSTTTAGKAKARIWPGLNPHTGQPVEPNPEAPNDPRRGIPFTMTWAKIEERKALLIQLAADNVPGRPKMVALDTVDMCVDLIKDFMVEADGKGNWDEMYGPSAWPKLYAYIVDFAVDLRRAGYGVALILHLGDKTLHLAGNQKEYLRDVPLVTDNLFNQIRRFTEIVACVEMETKNIPIMVKKQDPKGGFLKAPDGKTDLLVPSGKVRAEVEVYLTFVSEKLRGIAKKRAGLPDRILLPKADPWGAFQSAYTKALAANDAVDNPPKIGNTTPVLPKPAPIVT